MADLKLHCIDLSVYLLEKKFSWLLAASVSLIIFNRLSICVTGFFLDAITRICFSFINYGFVVFYVSYLFVYAVFHIIVFVFFDDDDHHTRSKLSI